MYTLHIRTLLSYDNSHVFHRPPFTLHLKVAATLALKFNLTLHTLKIFADAVTFGGSGGGGDVVVGSWMVKGLSFSTFFIFLLLSNRAISCILCFPTLTALNMYPETPTGQSLATMTTSLYYQYTYM